MGHHHPKHRAQVQSPAPIGSAGLPGAGSGLYVAGTERGIEAALVPQLLSIYAITFYLGSITRYRPHHFDRMISGPYGPRIQDFVTGQPLQFLYLMASEFAKQ